MAILLRISTKRTIVTYLIYIYHLIFSDEDICVLSPETGTCRGSFERFFYNKESGDCESFEYGGCDANANNFEDKETCENRCKIPKALPKTQGFVN